MMVGAADRRSGWLRRRLPLASTLLAVLLDAVTLSVPLEPLPAPFFTLTAIFYWTLFEPALMSAVATFCLGLLFDMLTGMPPGFTPLALLLVRSLLGGHRRALLAQPPLLLWVAFALASGLVELVRWLIASVYWMEPFRVLPLVREWLVTVAFYPPVAWLLDHLRRRLPRPRHAPGI